MNTLIALAGLPGTGKSTVAKLLAHALPAVYLRIDTIEQAIQDATGHDAGPAGYIVGYALALDNLRLGHTVIADSTNRLMITRAAWRRTAEAAGVGIIEIEMICSDPAEHRRRIETRDNPRAVDWARVCVQQAETEPWNRPPLRHETAGLTPAQSAAAILALVQPSRVPTTS